MEQLYFSKLNDLAWDIVSLIEIMNAKGTQQTNIGSTIKGNNSGRTIYLAETSYDLKDNRDNIKESLSQTASSCCQTKSLRILRKFIRMR